MRLRTVRNSLRIDLHDDKEDMKHLLKDMVETTFPKDRIGQR